MIHLFQSRDVDHAGGGGGDEHIYVYISIHIVLKTMLSHSLNSPTTR